MDYIPLAQNPWVKVLDLLATKIQMPSLSFYKYCVDFFGKAPTVITRRGPSQLQVYYDPPMQTCPAVVLQSVNTPPVEDHGAGNEQWSMTVSVVGKFEMKKASQDVAIAAVYELVRTILWAWRGPGSLDPLNQTNLLSYKIDGSLSPSFFNEEGPSLARIGFDVHFLLADVILG